MLGLHLSDLRKLSDADLIGEASRLLYDNSSLFDCDLIIAGENAVSLRQIIDELEYRWVTAPSINSDSGELLEGKE